MTTKPRYLDTVTFAQNGEVITGVFQPLHCLPGWGEVFFGDKQRVFVRLDALTVQ